MQGEQEGQHRRALGGGTNGDEGGRRPWGGAISGQGAAGQVDDFHAMLPDGNGRADLAAPVKVFLKNGGNLCHIFLPSPSGGKCAAESAKVGLQSGGSFRLGAGFRLNSRGHHVPSQLQSLVVGCLGAAAGCHQPSVDRPACYRRCSPYRGLR